MNEPLSIDDSGEFGDKTSQKIIVIIIELTRTHKPGVGGSDWGETRGVLFEQQDSILLVS